MNRRSRILKSSKHIQKKRRKLIITTLLFCLCIILFLTSIVLALRLPALQIYSIKTNTIYANDIEQKVLSILDGYYLYFIPKSNILFYPKSAIEKSLTDSFKKI